MEGLMTERTFTIAWPDGLGPMWMNKDNLMICLKNTCPNTDFIIEDVTKDEELDPLARPYPEL